MQGFGNKYYRIRKKAGGLAAELTWTLGAHRRSVKQAKGCRILVYHGICLQDHLRYNTLFTSVSSFERQIRLYKNFGRIISLDEYYSNQFDTAEFNICLTFDDGYLNNLKYVLPLLEKYKIPATFFITGISELGYDILWNDVLSIAYEHGPDHIELSGIVYNKRNDGKYIDPSGNLLANELRKADWNAREEMIAILEKWKIKADEDFWMQLQPDQIRELADSSLATIGCHGYYHNDLAKIPAENARDEMIRSKRYLEKLTGRSIKSVAFPYGSYNETVIAMAKETGFSQLLATAFLSQNDRNETTLRERLTINPFITATQQLRANIAGKY